MMVIATYDMVMNLGSGWEKIIRGQEFQPPGTGTVSRKEHAESLIQQGAAVRPDDWQKRKVRSDAGYAWAAEEVARANKVAERARLYQRASAEACAALQQAAMDAIDTERKIEAALNILEGSSTIAPD